MIKNIYINQRFIDPSVLLRYPLITKYSISDVSTIEGADIVDIMIWDYSKSNDVHNS